MKLQSTALTFFFLAISSLNAQVISIEGEDRAKLSGRDSTLQLQTSVKKIYVISIIKLIATPEKYHGKKVITSGFLNLQFEGTAIYIHKDDCDYGLNKNGFWVDFSDQVTSEQRAKVNGKYVLLEGTFDMERAGHFGLWSGTIKDIVFVTSLPKRE